jgi:hypothetical protein
MASIRLVVVRFWSAILLGFFVSLLATCSSERWFQERLVCNIALYICIQLMCGELQCGLNETSSKETEVVSLVHQPWLIITDKQGSDLRKKAAWFFGRIFCNSCQLLWHCGIATLSFVYKFNTLGNFVVFPEVTRVCASSLGFSLFY